MRKCMSPVESIEDLARGGDKLVRIGVEGEATMILPASQLLVREALAAIREERIWWYNGGYDISCLSDEVIASSLDRCSSVNGCEGCVWGQLHETVDEECVDSLSHEAARRLRRNKNDGK